MAAEFNPKIPLVGAQIALDSTGDKHTFTIPFKCVVSLLFLVIEGTSTHATTAVVKFDKRPTAGSDTSRGDGDVGALSKSASNQQGKMLYERPSSRITLDEGDQVVVEVTTANGNACTAVPGLLVEASPEDPANNSAMVSA
jgi:hypothetical protein